MQAGAGALAHGVEARQRGAAVVVHRHAAHRVVRRGSHGHRLAGGVDAHLAQRGGDVGKAAQVHPAHVQAHRLLAALLQLPLDREGHVVAGRELVHEPLAPRVQERGALAPHRLGDQKAVAGTVVAQRGGVELHELEVGQLGAGREGQRQARPHRTARIGGALPQGGHPAGGQDHGPAGR